MAKVPLLVADLSAAARHPNVVRGGGILLVGKAPDFFRHFHVGVLGGFANSGLPPPLGFFGVTGTARRACVADTAPVMPVQLLLVTSGFHLRAPQKSNASVG